MLLTGAPPFRLSTAEEKDKEKEKEQVQSHSEPADVDFWMVSFTKKIEKAS